MNENKNFIGKMMIIVVNNCKCRSKHESIISFYLHLTDQIKSEELINII